MCLFLPELLWVAFRRRAAQRAVSALHLVRLAMETYEPDWRDASLVARFETLPVVVDYPKVVTNDLKYMRKAASSPEDDSEGLGMLVEGKDIGEVAQEASRGIWARSEALRIWGTRAAVAFVEAELNSARAAGQIPLFTSKELVG